MSEKQAASPHHIANIAHLFFADQDAPSEGLPAMSAVTKLVVSFGDNVLHEYVCHQLNLAAADLWRACDWDKSLAELTASVSAKSTQGTKLILCLMDSEIGDCEIALKIGRLLGAAAPRDLQILVFPVGWAKKKKSPSWLPSPLQSSSSQASSSPGKLLAWCGQLTRSLAGHCPVTVTAMPPNGAGSNQQAAAIILKDIVRRGSVQL